MEPHWRRAKFALARILAVLDWPRGLECEGLESWSGESGRGRLAMVRGSGWVEGVGLDWDLLRWERQGRRNIQSRKAIAR
jgi:hypothetical protein